MNNRSCIVGYACINETLAESKPSIFVNRGMVKKTFLQKGLSYVSELALQNLYDLERIIRWNYQQGIYFYRMSSDMFPWSSEYTIDQLPQAELIKLQLKSVGLLAEQFGQRLTFHPGPFNVLASPNHQVVINTIKELEFHAQVMDLIGLPRSVYAKINIHLGGAYGDKEAAMTRFCHNFDKLSDAVKSRLTVENDDKVSMYTIQDLYDGIYKQIHIPLVFDTLHHKCHPGHLTEEKAFLLAYSTWPQDIMPIVHVSESRKIQDVSAPVHAHADYVQHCFAGYGKKVAVMLEAKAKEKAVLRYQTLCC